MSTEMRYVEDGGWYTLTLYGAHPTVMDSNGPVSSRPQWLDTIVTVATVGEHFLDVNDPPPDRILWFFVDDDCNLVRIDAFT